MTHVKRLFNLSGLLVLCLCIMIASWAVEGESQNAQLTPSDFNPHNPSQIPDPTIIDFDIIGISDVGQVLMIEGLENETIVISEDGKLEAGDTRLPRLVIHGIFDEDIRKWRDEIMNGNLRKRKIDIKLLDSSGSRRLWFEIYEAWPATFAFPVLAVDGSTRYMERVEFVYEDFNIRN